ncbi:MAG: hypothetical protein ACTHJM_12585 [Marmoricola sp.]
MRTFVVRIQEPRPADGGSDALHGVVEEIATGRQVRFTNGTQLLEIFRPQGDAADNVEDRQVRPTF